MAHFLFTELEFGGAVAAELAVVRQLLAAGHTISMIADPAIEEDASAAGVTDFRPWRTAPRRDTKGKESDYVRDWEVRGLFQMVDNLFERQMIGPAPAFAADTLAAIDDVHPDAVVSSFALVGAMLAGELRQIPTAGLVPNTVSLLVPGMPPPGLLPAGGPLGRVRDRVSDVFTERLLARAVPGLNAARAELGLRPTQSLRSFYASMGRMLALTSASYDFGGRTPDNLVFVGPQLDDPTWADPWSPPDDDPRPLVLVGMSSTFMDHVDVLQRVATALGDLPVQGLVTTGPTVDPAALDAPANVTVVRSAPHNQVLRHAEVFVTHGGHGSVVKGLAAGVPIVCMPLGRDQPDNAARIRHHGVGAALSPKASPARIARAVRRVLTEPAYRTAAEHLGAVLRADARSGRAVTELEALVG